MENLVRALRARNADPRIIELARNLKCSVCEESARRTPRPQATLEPLPPKWKVVQADSAYWTHPATHQQVQFILMVDEGCRFRVGQVIQGGSNRGVAGATMIRFFKNTGSQFLGNLTNFEWIQQAHVALANWKPTWIVKGLNWTWCLPKLIGTYHMWKGPLVA
jgi:hypothetical protein